MRAAGAIAAISAGIIGGASPAPLVALQNAQTNAISAHITAVIRESAPAGVDPVAWRRAARIYADRGFTPLWYDARTASMSTGAHALLRTVAASADEGLRPADYPLRAIVGAQDEVRRAREMPPARVVANAHLDVLLTATLADFASDLLTGRLSPPDVEPAWNIDAETVDVDSALAATLREPDLAGALDRLRSRIGDYGALVTGLARYREIVRRGGWPPVDSPIPICLSVRRALANAASPR